jgi:hypothetical protein
MYLAMARERGMDWAKLGGTLQNDILKEFHSQNEFIYPPEQVVKLVVDTIEFATKFVTRAGTASPSAAITSARQARPRRRNWPSRCATAWSTSRGDASAA